MTELADEWIASAHKVAAGAPETARRAIDSLGPLAGEQIIHVGGTLAGEVTFEAQVIHAGDSWALVIVVDDDGVSYARIHTEPGSHPPSWVYDGLTVEQAVLLLRLDLAAVRDTTRMTEDLGLYDDEQTAEVDCSNCSRMFDPDDERADGDICPACVRWIEQNCDDKGKTDE